MGTQRCNYIGLSRRRSILFSLSYFYFVTFDKEEVTTSCPVDTQAIL